MPHFDLEVDVVDVVHCGGKIRVSTHLPAAPHRPRDGVATAQLPATGSRTYREKGKRKHKQTRGTSQNAEVQLSFEMQFACTGSLHSLALMSAANDALPREEITEQGQRGSLRIQRQQQATKRSPQPACHATWVRPSAAQAAVVDSRHSLNV